MTSKISILSRKKIQVILLITIISGFLLPQTIKAQLPTAQHLAGKMTLGWNLGNMLESTWLGKNYKATTYQRTIDSVKAVGFNTVRLPVAWFFHSDTTTSVIDPTWLAHVKSMVDLCIKDSMYVIINAHWDLGWLENRVNAANKDTVNARQRRYWTQIANYFKDYDEHLLFAGANEPNVNNETGMSILLSYYQTFINVVRATGGNNNSRTLIIQGPSTDISNTDRYMNTMPLDGIANRLMVEVHYYTPWNFCGLNGDESWGKMFYYWGQGNHSTTDATRNSTWGEENDMDNSLDLMKTKFVDKGIPVIIGEYGAFRRVLSAPSNQALHNASIKSWYKYFVKSATSKGMIVYCWDTGNIINFSTGQTKDNDVLSSIMEGFTAATTTTSMGTVVDAKVNLYPNPFQTAFQLDTYNMKDIKRVEITDLVGNVLESDSIQSEAQSFGIALIPGIYIVRLMGDNWSKTLKVIKR